MEICWAAGQNDILGGFMADQVNKIVWFDIYCNKCKHAKLAGDAEPCNECLNNPVNWDSHKPVKFEEKK